MSPLLGDIHLKVILAYKNFAANKHISHIGLGVAALNTCKVLIRNGISCEVWPIVDSNDLRKRLNLYRSAERKPSITHVVISAPWIATQNLNHLTQLFPSITFVVNCHSNVGFLQADPQGMKLLKEAMQLEMAVPNFHVSANSQKLEKWIQCAYGQPCLYLPNLYYLHPHSFRRHRWTHGILRVGCFGATRPQKNIASAIGAAIQIGRDLKATVEIWISSGRSEGGGLTVLGTVREMCKNLPSVSLHESGWQSWPEFRQLVGSMHLLLQPSYTESFNMVTADGISEGVPSVVGESIDWVPKNWVANVDDTHEIARVGERLLQDPHASDDGLKALEAYIEKGLRAWKTFIVGGSHS